MRERPICDEHQVDCGGPIRLHYVKIYHYSELCSLEQQFDLSFVLLEVCT